MKVKPVKVLSLKKYAELKRLAKIGAALEMAIEKKKFIGRHASIVDEDSMYLPEFYRTKDLVKWARRQKNGKSSD